jgi:hypothetical protein
MFPLASTAPRARILGAIPAAEGSDAYAALAKDEAARVRELQRTDTEVRAHERAHQAAGGALTGAASFTYERGPDGQLYAVAGEVPVNLSPGRTPEESVQRARTARAAANAPANPSSADRAVAAMAAALEAVAMRDLLAQVYDAPPLAEDDEVPSEPLPNRLATQTYARGASTRERSATRVTQFA